MLNLQICDLLRLSILLCLLAVNLIQFDPLGGQAMLLSTLVGLAVYFSCLFTTFFLGGLTVAGVFSLWARQAHQLYYRIGGFSPLKASCRW